MRSQPLAALHGLGWRNSKGMERTPWDPEGVDVVLDSQGRLHGDGVARLDPGTDLREHYKRLVAARCLDIRFGRLGLPMYASFAGEEAPIVSASSLLTPQDWIYPGPRDAAAVLTRGLSVEDCVAQVMGEGPARGRLVPGQLTAPELNVGPVMETVGMQVAMATGHARGQKLAGEGAVTVAVCGEGTTTTGLFHESLCIAATSDIPLVVVVKSQQWPTAAPAEAGLLGETVADRSKMLGLHAVRVDGADPIATHAAITNALGRARAGQGASVVEAVVTQLAHQHGDGEGSVPPGHRDPVERLRRYLDQSGNWTQTFQDVLEAEFRGRFDKAHQAHQAQREDVAEVAQ